MPTHHDGIVVISGAGSRGNAMQIRDAALEDIPQITDIYNSIVLSSTAIYNDTPVTLDERTAWWRARLDRGFPVLVATDADEPNPNLLGYASFGEFRPWPGYRFTVEGTVHIRDGVRGQGIGTRLLAELIARARALGKHIMIAGVDSENHASLRFLEGHGFVPAGQLREVGYKFDRYLHLNFLELWLEDPAAAPTHPIPGVAPKT